MRNRIYKCAVGYILSSIPPNHEYFSKLKNNLEKKLLKVTLNRELLMARSKGGYFKLPSIILANGLATTILLHETNIKKI